jgi:uncharacterized protein GlcG (DUF336 family)
LLQISLINIRGELEVIEAKSIGLEEARKVIDAMLEYSTVKKPGPPMAHAVVDRAGVLVCFARMDGAPPLVRRMAENKAYTAMIWQLDTRDILGIMKSDPHVSIAYFGEPDRQAVIPGGVPIKASDGSIIGATGSSGRSPDEDEEAALAGAKAFEG